MGGKYYDGSSGIGMGGMDWIDLTRDRDRWWTLVNAVMNLQVPQNVGNSSNSCERLPSQGLCSME